MTNLRSGQEQKVCSELALGSALGLRSGRVSDLQKLLTDLAKQFGTKTALAERLGLSLERLIKVMKDPKESLGVLNCLKLAQVSGLPPSQILIMAGKKDVADLLDSVYGRTAERPTNPEALATQWWPEMTPKAKDALRTLLDELATERPPKPRKRGAR